MHYLSALENISHPWPFYPVEQNELSEISHSSAL